MAQLFVNNAFSTVSTLLAIGGTSLVVADGSKFPTPTGGDFFLLTLVGLNANAQETTWEVVKCTARATNTLTIVRAQEGTVAAQWPVATQVEVRLTAAPVVSAVNHVTNVSNPHATTKAQVGLGSVDNTADSAKPVSTAQASAIAAVVYTHPTNHPATIITQDSDNQFVSSAQKTAWDAKGDVLLTDVQTLTNKRLSAYYILDKTITNAAATGTVNLDLSVATVFDLTLTGATTLAIVNQPALSNETLTFTVKIMQSGTAYALTWWGGITWLTTGGSVPSAPAANKTIEYIFTSTASGVYVGRKGAST